jgi:hypothetical protein
MAARPVAFRRDAISQVAAQLALGFAPFTLLAGLHPSLAPGQAKVTWHCLVVSTTLACLLNRGRQATSMPSAPVLRRLAGSLLLGGSLAAIPWAAQGLPILPVAMVAGLVLRWGLYLLETRDLILADRRRMALPSLSTRLRRGITWFTGALIPLLVLSGLPAVPLLTLSFALTAFNLWTVACELRVSELRAKA